MRWNRKEYLEYVTFKSNKKRMFVELMGPLIGLEDEWRSQGATEDEINLTAFDWDYVVYTNCGASFDVFGTQEEKIFEEPEDVIAYLEGFNYEL